MPIRFSCQISAPRRLTDAEMEELEGVVSNCLAAALSELRSSRSGPFANDAAEIRQNCTSMSNKNGTTCEAYAHD